MKKGILSCLLIPVAFMSSSFLTYDTEIQNLVSSKWINIRTSYYVSGAIRKGLNSKDRVEGEPLNGISVFLQNLTLPVTRQLDKIFTSRKDIARLEFKRIQS